MGNSLRKWLIRGTALLIVLAVALAGASLYLGSAAFRGRLLDAINGQISGRVSLESIDLAVLPGRFAVQRFLLTDGDGLPLVALERLEIRFFWLPLLRRQIHIAAIMVENAQADLTFDDQDRLNLVRALVPPKGPKRDRAGEQAAFRWRLVVDDIDMTVSRVDFQRPSTLLAGRIKNIAVRGDCDAGLYRQKGELRVTVADAGWQMGDRIGTTGRMALRTDYDSNRTRPLALDFDYNHSRLELTAFLQWADSPPTLDAVVAYQLAWDDLRPWLPPLPVQDWAFTGAFSGQVLAQGSLYDPTVTGTLDLDRFVLAGVDVQQLRLRLGLHQRIVTLEQIEGRGPWGRADLNGHIDLQPLFGLDFRQVVAGVEALEYDLTLKTDGLQPHMLPFGKPPIEGIWQLQATIRGKGLGQPDATGQAGLEASVVANAPTSGVEPIQGALSTRLKWEGRRIDFSGMRVTVGPNHLETAGWFDLDSFRIQARGVLTFDRLEYLEPLVGVGLPSGRGALDFTCSGALSRPAIQSTLRVNALSYGTWHFGQVELKAGLDEAGRLDISDLLLENQGSLIRGDGRLDLMHPDGGWQPDPTLTAKLEFENLQLSDFGLLEALKGQLNGRLELSGNLPALHAKLTLDQSPIGWQEYAAMATAAASWHNGHLQVDSLKLSRGNSRIDLAGHIHWRDENADGWLTVPVMDLTVRSDGIELADIHADHKGRVALQAALRGPATDLAGSFSLKAAEVETGIQRIAFIDVKGRLADQALFVDNFDIALAPEQSITGHGWYAFDQRFEIALSATAIDLRSIDAVGAHALDGRLAITLKGSGSLADPIVQASLAITAPHFNHQRFDDFHAQIDMTGKQLKLQADLNFHMQAVGHLDSGNFEVNADFNRSDLSPYLGLWLDPRWRGHLTGNLRAAGNWRSIEQTGGRLAFDHAELLYDGHSLLSTDRLLLDLKDNNISMPQVRFVLPGDGHLDISAAGHLPDDVQARVNGRLPLEVFALFGDALNDVAGIIVLDGGLHGRLQDPAWQVDLNLEKVGFVIPGLLQSVEAVSGTIRLRADSLLVENVTGAMDSGRFRLAGSIRLEDWMPVDGRLDLNLQALPLYWPDTMEITMSGDVALQGGPSGSLLSGNLVLVEGLYYKDVRLNLLAGMTQTRRAQDVTITRPKPDWMRGIRMDLALRHRNPFLVDNNLARLEVVPDLRVGGTLANPVVSGRAAVTEGELFYSRKTFTVQRGVVDFINANKIEPTMDIMGAVRFRKWLITLGVSGTPDQLRFSLNSDPPESDGDILSLLLVGRTNAEMVQGEGGGGQTTSQMLAQLMATAWGEDIKRTTGMDIFEVGTGSEEAVDDPNRMQLTVGKRLSRRLTVKYGVETQEGEMIQRAISEYRFWENILATGFQDNKGKYGGELLFRMEFR